MLSNHMSGVVRADFYGSAGPQALEARSYGMFLSDYLSHTHTLAVCVCVCVCVCVFVCVCV
jgi:hypothetical protein